MLGGMIVNIFPHDVLLELRFQRHVERLRRLGPRAVGELLAEIGAARSCRMEIDRRLARYANLNPEFLWAIGGDRFPPLPIHEVCHG